MVYVDILAGGTGKRMGNTDLPKQFMMLGTKPIIIHTVEQFIINQNVDKIIVCCPKEWTAYMQDLIKKYIEVENDIDVVESLGTRNDTVYNDCIYIKEKYGLKSDDIIIIHDAVRPFITQRIINDNINGLKDCSAVDTVISATDTIVEASDNTFISNIPNRKIMYQGQTPQSFNIIELLKGYEELSKEEKEILTDTCKIFTLKDKPVKLVDGEVYNLKITTMHDIKIANAILSERGMS